MKNNPTGAMGVPDYLGWNWKSQAGLPVVCIPGCPAQPDNTTETLLYLVLHLAGMAPVPELDDALRPKWLFGRTVREGCNRAGFAEQGNFATEYGDDPRCLVKLGCKGPVVKCNVPVPRLAGGHGRLPERRRHLHGLHDARLPRQVHAVHGRGPTGASGARELRAGSPTGRWSGTSATATSRTSTTRSPSGGHAGPELAPATPSAGKGERSMATVETPQEQKVMVKEMSWDPITRIVGSLGIHTEIDFTNQRGATSATARR